MKKFCITALSILMMGTSSLTLTSCDTEELGNIISGILESGILGELLGGQTGTTYTYTTAQGTAQLWTLNSEGQYIIDTDTEVKLEGTTFEVKDCGTSANITVPALSFGTTSLGSTTLSGLHMESVTLDGGGTAIALSIPDSYNGQGTLTVGGKQYNLSSAYFDEGNTLVSSVDFGTTKLQLFFGENGEYVVNIEDLVGNIVTPQN